MAGRHIAAPADKTFCHEGDVYVRVSMIFQTCIAPQVTGREDQVHTGKTMGRLCLGC